eukprot:jgi/Bigna1/84856/estExt_fgenesh1_pg.C_10220
MSSLFKSTLCCPLAATQRNRRNRTNRMVHPKENDTNTAHGDAQIDRSRAMLPVSRFGMPEQRCGKVRPCQRIAAKFHRIRLLICHGASRNTKLIQTCTAIVSLLGFRLFCLFGGAFTNWCLYPLEMIVLIRLLKVVWIMAFSTFVILAYGISRIPVNEEARRVLMQLLEIHKLNGITSRSDAKFRELDYLRFEWGYNPIDNERIRRFHNMIFDSIARILLCSFLVIFCSLRVFFIFSTLVYSVRVVIHIFDFD